MPLVPRVLSVVVLCLFVWVATAPPAAAELSNREKKLFMKINAARANHGRQPLQLSLKISNKARNHSQKMAASGQIYHSCLTCKFQGWNWQALGENVGTGPGVKAVHKKFMKSPGHRANILGTQYDKVGVGIVWAKGKLWVTEIFYG